MSHFAGTTAVVTLALLAGCGGGVDSSQETGASGGAGGATLTTTTTSTTTTTTSSSSTTTTGTGGSGGTGGMAPVCTPSNGDTILAIDKLYFGDTNPDDTPNTANGWKQYGFNIDGKVSDATATDLCQPNSGAMKSAIYPDGDNGIDNSFGKNIVPLLLQFMAGFSGSVNQNIADGTFTLMLDFAALGAGADQMPLQTKLYAGADLGHPAKFDGSDCWPVRPELLSTPTDITTSKIVFPDGALAGNVWQSGVASDLTLAFPTPAGNIALTIHKAQLSLQLDADHKGGALGLVGGVLDTEEFLKAIKQVIPNALLCGFVDGPVRQASDILNDGTQDPAKTCNGISIGLGFKAKIVQLGGIAAPGTPGTGVCP